MVPFTGRSGYMLISAGHIVCLLLALAAIAALSCSRAAPTAVPSPILSPTATPETRAAPPPLPTPSPTRGPTPAPTPDPGSTPRLAPKATPNPSSITEWPKVYNKDILDTLRFVVDKNVFRVGEIDFSFPDLMDLGAVEALNTEFNLDEIKALFSSEKIIFGDFFDDDVYLLSYISKKESNSTNIWETRRDTIEQIYERINDTESKFKNFMKLYDLPITKSAVKWGVVTSIESNYIGVLSAFKKEVLEPLREPIRFKDDERFKKLASVYLVSHTKYSEEKSRYEEIYKKFPWIPPNELKFFDIIKEYPIILASRPSLSGLPGKLSPLEWYSSNTWINLMTIQYEEPFRGNRFTRVGEIDEHSWGLKEVFSLAVANYTDKLLHFFEMEKNKIVFSYLRTLNNQDGRTRLLDRYIRTGLVMIYKTEGDLTKALEFYSKEENYDSTGILFSKGKVGFRDKDGKVFYANYVTGERIISILPPKTKDEVPFEKLSIKPLPPPAVPIATLSPIAITTPSPRPLATPKP